jgi:hypothetical protein
MPGDNPAEERGSRAARESGRGLATHAGCRVWAAGYEPPGEWSPAPDLGGSSGPHHPPTYDMIVIFPRTTVYAGRVHFWLAAVPQVQICNLVPSAELGPVASRHLPSDDSVPPLPTVHCWAAVPLQS